MSRDILLTKTDGSFTRSSITLEKGSSVAGPKFLLHQGILYKNTGMGNAIFFREVDDFKNLDSTI
jgi:hypothetical protein